MITFSQINARKQLAADLETQKTKAILRDTYLSQDDEMIKYFLQQDLLSYMDGADITRMKLITLNNFVKRFLEKISHVYKTPPIIKHEDEIFETSLRELLSEVDFYNKIQDCDIKTKLHNTILIGSMYYPALDKLYLDNSFNAGTTRIVPFDGYELEPAIVYRYYTNKDEKDYYVVWDRINNNHYYVSGEPKFENYELIGGEKIQPEEFAEPGKAIFPFVTRRHIDQDYGFWQNGMDALITLAECVNLLLTVATDDTAQEAIRILILNFKPDGVEDGKGFKAGIRHPIMPADSLPGDETPSGQIVNADLYNEEIIGLVESLIEITSGLEGIGNIIKADLEKNLSGVAIRLRNEPILVQWQKDINIFRKNDLELIGKIVEVNNFFRKKKQIATEKIKDIEIDYLRPQMVTDEEAEYKLEKEKWQDGTSSPVKYMMKKNPELRNEQAAMDIIAQNLKEYDELYGVSSDEEIDGNKDTPE